MWEPSIRHDKGMRQAARLMVCLGLSLAVILSTMAAYFLEVATISEENQKSAALLERSLLSSIEQFEYLPALLARDARVIGSLEGNNNTGVNAYLAFVAKQSGADKVFLLNPEGLVISASNYYDSQLSFVGHNYSFRPYFQRSLLTQQKQFYFAKGITTGIPGFFISEPVIHQGRLLGVIVVKLELSELVNSWKSASDLLLVSDRNNIVILASNSNWLYRQVDQVAPEVLQSIRDNRQFPNESHPMMYTDTALLTLGLSEEARYWQIEHDWYLVDEFPVRGREWRFYHLVSAGKLAEPAAFVFLISMVLAVVVYLLVLERDKKANFRRIARQTEIRRREDLQRLIDNIHIGVVVFDPLGDIRSMNQYAENLLMPAWESRGADTPNILRCLSLPEPRGFDAYRITPEKTLHYHETETRHIDPDQRTPVMFALAQVSYAEHQGYLMTLVNITKRKNAEDELVHLNASLESTVAQRTVQLEQAQQELLRKSKTLALGNMAATIVHELSQPLAAINSSVAAIEKKIERENWAGVGESASRLKPLSSKMRSVIQLLKNFSYEDTAQITPVQLHDWVDEALDTYKDQLVEKGICLTVRNEAGDACVPISRIKLDLVFSNLIKNAVDAVEKSAHPEMTLDVAVQGNEAVIAVADNGGGMDEAIMDQLFTPYFTTKDVGKGLGLGLAIVHEIALQQKGRVTADNDGGGARFSIFLPTCQPLALSEESGYESFQSSERGGHDGK